jgi:FkbM family methyltransferase
MLLARDDGATIVRMSLYGQEPEAKLLAAFLSGLDHRSIIDVGAERGVFVEEMLRAGADKIYAFEPEPANAGVLRERFDGDARVTVHEYAISSADGSLELHRSSTPSGEAVTFGHTLLERPETDEIAWHDSVEVSGRSLASLVAGGELPPRIGILKVDTEGHDLAVIEGMGDLDCDVVMVEHWSELPHSLGPCPWTAGEMVSALAPRGFSHYAFVAHRGEFVVLQWDDATVQTGHMGNLVFLHDRMLSRLLPAVLECASSLAMNAVELGERQAAAARERIAVIEDLDRERHVQAASASERLAVIEDLDRERHVQATAASERLALIQQLSSDDAATRGGELSA